MICKQIAEYLLNLKFGLDVTDFRYVGAEFDEFLPEERETLTMGVIQEYDTLAKAVRDLQGLPLTVISTQPTSPVFR